MAIAYRKHEGYAENVGALFGSFSASVLTVNLSPSFSALLSSILAAFFWSCGEESLSATYDCGQAYFCNEGEVFKKPASVACSGLGCQEVCKSKAESQGSCTRGCFLPGFESDTAAVCEVVDYVGAGGNGGTIAPLVCSDVFFCKDSSIFQGADGVFCGPTGCDDQACIDTATFKQSCASGCALLEVVDDPAELCVSAGGAGTD